MNKDTTRIRTIALRKPSALNQTFNPTMLAKGFANKVSIDYSHFKPISPYERNKKPETVRPRSASTNQKKAFLRTKKTFGTESSEKRGIQLTQGESKPAFPKITFSKSPDKRLIMNMPLQSKETIFSKQLTSQLTLDPTKTKLELKTHRMSGVALKKTFGNHQLVTNAPIIALPAMPPQSYRIRWFESAGNFQAIDSILGFRKVLGEGAFAKVHEAEEYSSGSIVAVKVFDKRKLSESSPRKALQNEINVLSKLDHPSIVRLRRVVEDHKSVCLVLDHWGSHTLKDWIKDHGWTAEAHAAMRDVGEALVYMHQRGIYHRDIKLTNIMVKQGKGCLLDFGMAVESTLDKEYLFCGTSNYLSPEMVKRSGYQLAPNDVWAFAVALFRASSGHYPFGGKLGLTKTAKRSRQ